MVFTKNFYVYILTNNSGTFYVGFTNNLERRMYEHVHEIYPGFTKRYKLKKLVWYEQTFDVNAAIAREKQVKDFSRSKKLALILSLNPELRDLYLDFSQSSK